MATAKGCLLGKPPNLKASQEPRMVALWRAGKRTGAELAELFGVNHSTLYRAVQRSGPMSMSYSTDDAGGSGERGNKHQ